jgi:hypothetical protein
MERQKPAQLTETLDELEALLMPTGLCQSVVKGPGNQDVELSFVMTG